MSTPAYQRFAGLCAILAAVAGLLYAVSFVVIARSAPQTGALLSALFLLIGGLLTQAVLIGLFEHLREWEPSFARLAVLLGLAGAFGAAIHGGYDLANALHPPLAGPAEQNLPSQIDPRGLLTFGVTGLSLLIISSLILRARAWPSGLGYLGLGLSVLLLVLYLGRLISSTRRIRLSSCRPC